MVSERVQGPLRGSHAQEWAGSGDRIGFSLFGVAFEAADVKHDTHLLDAGCGAELMALLETLRVARVTYAEKSRWRPFLPRSTKPRRAPTGPSAMKTNSSGSRESARSDCAGAVEGRNRNLIVR